MKLAVCLLTCDRPDYTRATLESFARFNPPSPDILLLHADDGSVAPDNLDLAYAHGFHTVWSPVRRAGQGAAVRMMWAAAVAEGCERILHLENDWLWTGPIPHVDHPCVRLYGERKAKDGPRAPTGTRNLATGGQVAWRPLAEGWEQGVIHWGGPPSIAGAKTLLAAAQGAERLKDITNRLSLATARPAQNIVWHIGEETTPIFRGANAPASPSLLERAAT